MSDFLNIVGSMRMTWPDVVNGGFELLAGLFVLNHCRVLHRDQMVRGVSLLSTAFFWCWGLWNLYYYPHLGQIASTIGGISVVSANTLWIVLMIRYARR